MDGEELIVDMVEIPHNFSIKCVTDKVFSEIMEKHQYGRYVGNRSRECIVKESD